MSWEGPASNLNIGAVKGLSPRVQLVSAGTGEVYVDKKIFELPESGARLSIQYSLGAIYSARLECSLPKVAHGSNLNPLPWGDAVEVARHVDREAGNYLHWEQPFADRAIRRIDATGHIHDVSDPSRVLKAVSEATPFKPRVSRNKGRVEGFSCGSGNWHFSAYDKEAEVAHRMKWARGINQESAHRDFPASRQIIRCELRLNTAELKRLRLLTFPTVDEEVLKVQHRRRFHEVGLGKGVMGMNQAARKIRRSALSGSERTTLLGILAWDVFGEDPGVSDKTLRKYRHIARELGIAVDDVETIAEIVRLDYDSGIEVREAMR